MKSEGADCFVFSGITANGAVQLYKDVAAALPDAKLYGPDGVAESGFSDPTEGGIPADVASQTKVTVATLSPDEYPPEGQKFFDGLRGQVRRGEPGPVRDLRLRGDEARARHAARQLGARLQRQAGHDRRAFNTKGRESVLGTYDIDENGDTTLTDYGVYTIEGGELQFDKTIQAGGRLIRTAR